MKNEKASFQALEQRSFLAMGLFYWVDLYVLECPAVLTTLIEDIKGLGLQETLYIKLVILTIS